MLRLVVVRHVHLPSRSGRLLAVLHIVVAVFVAFLSSGIAHAGSETSQAKRAAELGFADAAPTASAQVETEEPWCPDDCTSPTDRCSCCSNLVVMVAPLRPPSMGVVREVCCVQDRPSRFEPGIRFAIDRPPRG